MMKIKLILGLSILLLVTLTSAQASSVTWNFGLNSSCEYQFRGAQNVDVLGKLNNVGLFNDPSVPAMNCVNSNPSYFNKRSPVSFSYAWNYEK